MKTQAEPIYLTYRLTNGLQCEKQREVRCQPVSLKMRLALQMSRRAWENATAYWRGEGSDRPAGSEQDSAQEEGEESRFSLVICTQRRRFQVVGARVRHDADEVGREVGTRPSFRQELDVQCSKRGPCVSGSNLVSVPFKMLFSIL